MSRLRLARSIAVSILLTLGLAGVPVPGWAFSITNLTIAKDSTDTANATSNSGNPRSQISSGVEVVSSSTSGSDVVGSSLDFTTRYFSLLALDRPSSGGSSDLAQTSAYVITFTVENPTGGLYQLDIDTSRLGTLLLLDDSGGSASATLEAVTGTVDGVTSALLALSSVSTGTQSAGAMVAVNQSTSTLELLSSDVTKTWTLFFTWGTNALVSAQDAAAIRLGHSPGGLSSTTVDDYSSASAAAADGHFVTATLTLLSIPNGPNGPAVPLPGTLTLLVVATGVLGAARLIGGHRRRP